MSDQVVIDGNTYISSRRAAEIGQYTQDYVGQLARAGKIDARRIGGLWYVREDALKAHKTKAESYVPTPPRHDNGNTDQSHSYVGFDGKRYISASKASEMLGYHQDYIGQLARSGKILSQQVGNRWYVEFEGIKAHRIEKDKLLGAVQAESVGLVRRQPTQNSMQENGNLHFKYISENNPVIPAKDLVQAATPEVTRVEPNNEIHTVPIRVIRQKPSNLQAVAQKNLSKESRKSTPRVSGNTMNILVFSGIAVSIAFALVLAVGQLQQSRESGDFFNTAYSKNTSIANGFTRGIRAVQTFLNTVFSKQLLFQRERW